MELLSIIVLIVLLLISAGVGFYFHSIDRPREHRKNRNERLVEAVLKPMSKPVKTNYPEIKHDNGVPKPLQRINYRTILSASHVAPLKLREADLFYTLRKDIFDLKEEEYKKNFQQGKLEGGGNLGFSGAAFFFTPGNKKFIVKSLPNSFEWHFFYETLLTAYGHYVREVKDTLLARITDSLCNFDVRVWVWLRLGVPGHFIVMQNLLEGFDKEKGWEQWDLKPKDYLRADLILPKSAEEEERLLFKKDGIKLSKKNYDLLADLCFRDTAFLAAKGVVDYSLLLGRFPNDGSMKLDEPQNFFTGVVSSDKKYVYRISIIDFFFSHRTVPLLIKNASQIVHPVKPDAEFTFTDKPKHYAEKFMQMLEEYCKIEGPEQEIKKAARQRSVDNLSMIPAIFLQPGQVV
ncbi:PIP5K1B [Acrasis kona]|uniref:PIP5K1B n=1 Tax=Acrasis kona TaxID=1008807 RepID=A0AAW2YKG9_9EUKA